MSLHVVRGAGRWARALTGAAVLPLLLFAQAARAQPAAEPLAPGTHTLKLTWAGQERTVIVHVPPAAASARPLLLALHGGGGSAAHMASEDRYGLVAAADRHGFTVAFPNGNSRLPGGGLATWNAGRCCGAARDQDADDTGFLRAVVALVQQRTAVAPDRVFAAGMSNGGMLAHRLACEAADVFRGVAAVAGTDVTTVCQPARPVAVLHLHARDDDHVLYHGGAGERAFPNRRLVTDFTSVPETMARWQQRLACSAAPQVVLQRPGVQCQQWSACAPGAALQLCTLDEGGHRWPGEQAGGTVRTPRLLRRNPQAASAGPVALDANEAIWAFFSALPPR